MGCESRRVAGANAPENTQEVIEAAMGAVSSHGASGRLVIRNDLCRNNVTGEDR